MWRRLKSYLKDRKRHKNIPYGDYCNIKYLSGREEVCPYFKSLEKDQGKCTLFGEKLPINFVVWESRCKKKCSVNLPNLRKKKKEIRKFNKFVKTHEKYKRDFILLLYKSIL